MNRTYRVLKGRHVEGGKTYVAGTPNDTVTTARNLAAIIPGKFELLREEAPVPPKQPKAPPETVVDTDEPEDEAPETSEEADQEPETTPAKKRKRKKRRPSEWDD